MIKKSTKNKEFESEVLEINRVERMASGGRRLRFRALVIAGDKKGRVGAGLAKGTDVQQAIEKATKRAQREMIKIPITKEGTISHEVKAKYGAATVLLKPQSEGRGLVAGGTLRTICNMAGIENISGKLLGNTRNKLNNSRATLKALQQLKPIEEKGSLKKKEDISSEVTEESIKQQK